jgi:hypothetical protein
VIGSRFRVQGSKVIKYSFPYLYTFFWIGFLPGGLEPFYLPVFLSADIFGGSAANKIIILCALRELCGEKI